MGKKTVGTQKVSSRNEAAGAWHSALRARTRPQHSALRGVTLVLDYPPEAGGLGVSPNYIPGGRVEKKTVGTQKVSSRNEAARTSSTPVGAEQLGPC